MIIHPFLLCHFQHITERGFTSLFKYSYRFENDLWYISHSDNLHENNLEKLSQVTTIIANNDNAANGCYQGDAISTTQVDYRRLHIY